MSLKRYRNELIVLLASFLMLVTLLYKNAQHSSQTKEAASIQHEISEFKEIVALRKVWVDTQISKKVEKLKDLLPATKVKWGNQGKKVTAVYAELSSTELNKLISNILSLAVEIVQLDIKKTGSAYHVEFKCKW